MKQARVSIIMGIYNCASTLDEAIESILNQTYTDWKLIMCDDGSTDNTYEVAKKYIEQYPDKFVLLQNEKNMGLNFTLNRCLSAADGEFIARMDGDDLSLPERLEHEVAALEQNPDMALVSMQLLFFDENGTWGKCAVLPRPEANDFLHGTPFCHACCMVRKSAFDLVGGYTDDTKYLRVEDYELWVKIYAAGLRGMNLEEALYLWRDDRNAQSRRKFRYRINEARVKAKAVRVLKLPVYGYLHALRPIVVGLLPSWFYRRLHRNRLGNRQ